MKKRLLALCLALMMQWTIPAMAEGIDLSGLFSVFNVKQEAGVIGLWQIMGVYENAEMEGAVQSMTAEGNLVQLEITQDTMTLSFIYPGKETNSNTGPITHAEGVIYSGSAEIPYEITGDEMRMTKPEGVMVLKRIAPTSPIGNWKLTSIGGSDEGTEMWLMLQAAGASVQLVITDTTLTAAISSGGETTVESGHITIDDQYITTRLQLPYTVEDDTLTLYSGDVVMTFARQ